MTDIVNQGLAHYKKWHGGEKAVNYEPVFNAYFGVVLTLPSTISTEDVWLSNLTKIDGFDSSKAYTTVKEQKYKGAVRSYMGGAAPNQSQDLNLSFSVNLNDANQIYVYKLLSKWCDLVYNPRTGKMGLKRNYVAEKMVVSQYNADGVVWRQVTFFDVFPTNRPKGPDTFDWESDEIYAIDGWTLRCDDWEEALL